MSGIFDSLFFPITDGCAGGNGDGGSSNAAALNIAYGNTAPSDTSKLWIKSDPPGELKISNNPEMIHETLTTVGEMPLVRNGQAAAAVGTNIYILGGNGVHKSIYKFDTLTNTIETLSAELPYSLYTPGCAVVGTKIYLFGGSQYVDSSSTIYHDTICVFDTTDETLEVLSATLPAVANGIAAAAVGTDVYLFGGYTPQSNESTNPRSNNILCFNTVTQTISTLATKIPKYYANDKGGVSNASAVAVGNKIYLIGGLTTADSTNTYRVSHEIYVFDAEFNTITQDYSSLSSAGYPSYTLMGRGAAVPIGTKLYLFGGMICRHVSSTESEYITTEMIRVYDTVSKTLETLSVSLLDSLNDFAAAVVGTNIYLFGGVHPENSTNTKIKKIDRFKLKMPLNNGDIFIHQGYFKNTFDLLKSPTKLEISVNNIYKGGTNNYAEPCNAYLHDGTKWVNVNTGESS